MEMQFIVVSGKHSDKDGIMFWRPDNAGYTYNPFQAGIYSEETILNDLDYYCDSSNVPINIKDESSLRELGVVGNKLSVEFFKQLTRAQRKFLSELSNQLKAKTL